MGRKGGEAGTSGGLLIEQRTPNVAKCLACLHLGVRTGELSGKCIKMF